MNTKNECSKCGSTNLYAQGVIHFECGIIDDELQWDDSIIDYSHPDVMTIVCADCDTTVEYN